MPSPSNSIVVSTTEPSDSPLNALRVVKENYSTKAPILHRGGGIAPQGIVSKITEALCCGRPKQQKRRINSKISPGKKHHKW